MGVMALFPHINTLSRQHRVLFCYLLAKGV